MIVFLIQSKLFLFQTWMRWQAQWSAARAWHVNWWVWSFIPCKSMTLLWLLTYRPEVHASATESEQRWIRGMLAIGFASCSAMRATIHCG